MGRAGRDQQPAECLTLYNREDTLITQYFLNQKQDLGEELVNQCIKNFHKMTKFCLSIDGCQRKALCKYLGEDVDNV